MSAHQQPSRSRPAFDQKWTEEEVAILRAKWSDVTVSNEDLPSFLRERSLKAARNMAHSLRLGPRPRVRSDKPEKQPINFWCEAEDVILRSNWHITSRQQIAEMVGRTPDSVSHRAVLLKLGRSTYAREIVAARAKISIEVARANRPSALPWTAEEIAALHQHWPDVEAVHKATGRSRSGVERKARAECLPPRTGYRLPSPDVARGSKEESRLTLRPDAVPKIKRNCLCCGRGFEAPTKFIRMCGPCKGSRD